MDGSATLTCDCGVPAMGRCADCARPICREHSFYADDDLVCDQDLARRQQAQAQRQVASFDDAIRRYDEESARRVATFLQDAGVAEPEQVPVARRSVPVPPRPRSLRERWGGNFWRRYSPATTGYEHHLCPAHVVHHRESSDLSDPPIHSIETVWVFLSGHVAITKCEMRMGGLFRVGGGSLLRQSQDERFIEPLGLAPEGFEPWAPLPRDTRAGNAPVGALPFYCDEYGPIPGRPQSHAEMDATREWFTKTLDAYLQRARAS